MIISLSANGTIHTIQPEKINQGSNKINTIYVIAPLSTGTAIEMSFEFPNGEITQSYVLLKGAEIEQGLNTWYLDVSSYLSQYKGIVRYQLKGTINGEVVATGKGSFNVIEGVDWQLPPTPDENTYQLILNKIAQIDTEALNTKGIAEEAKQQADNAVVLSNSAKEIAESAKVVADEALQVANAIDGKAITALENSQNAVATANNAIEIANGANKSKAFDTFVDMTNFIKVKANVDNLTVGSSLYIKATDVPDYWVTEKLETPNELGYYCNIQALESKLPDISNMVTTDTDQTISGSKDFTGGLKKGGKTVATEEQVNALENTVSSHTEQITALNGQINTQGESIASLQTTKADKSELPTKVSDLQNDAEYVTESGLTQKDYATNTVVSTNYVKNSDYQEFAINVNTAMTELSDSVDLINSKIPDGASPSNKLADKNFVNSSINNIAAFYITADAAGNAFETVAQLNSATTFYSGGVERTPTRNDYCIVRTDENHNNATTRYYYQNQWEFQYIVNETALTADQLAALNSGITSGKVTQISTNKTNIEKEVADRQNADSTLQSSITANTNSITSLQENKADKTEIPTNADFTLAGLSEKSYNSLTDKPVIPEGVKLYDTYGSNTDGAMTQQATTQFVNQLRQDVVHLSGSQIITGDKNFIGGVTKNAVDLATVNDITTAIAAAKAQWLLDMNPVGTIIENNTGTNPSTYIGGTWQLYGQGRVTVGIDSSDSDFGGSTGSTGTQTSTLTISQYDSGFVTLPASKGQIDYVTISYNNQSYTVTKDQATTPYEFVSGCFIQINTNSVNIDNDSADATFGLTIHHIPVEAQGAGQTGGSKALQSHTHSATFTGKEITGQHSPIPEGKSTAYASGCFSVPSGASKFGGIYQNATGDGRPVTFTATPEGTINISNAGNGNSGNLQPYIVVYRWIRTA